MFFELPYAKWHTDLASNLSIGSNLDYSFRQRAVRYDHSHGKDVAGPAYKFNT
jgi:hypothetical protein